MKKIWMLTLILVLSLQMTACNNGGGKITVNGGEDNSSVHPEASSKEKVVTSNPNEEPASEEPEKKVSDSKEKETKVKEVNGLTEDAVMKYLTKHVKEISVYNEQVIAYSKENNTPKDKPIMRIESAPDPKSKDPYLRDYFAVYVGEMRDNHTNRFATFLVKKDLKEILAEDVVNGGYMSLEDWRKSNGNE